MKGAIGGTLDFVDTLLDWDFVSGNAEDGYNLGESFKNFGNQVWNRLTVGLANALNKTAYQVENHSGKIFLEDEFGNIFDYEASDLWDVIGSSWIDTAMTSINDFLFKDDNPNKGASLGESLKNVASDLIGSVEEKTRNGVNKLLYGAYKFLGGTADDLYSDIDG